MDFPSNSHNSGEQEKCFRRHSANQIAKLEEMFKEYPRPDERQRRELSEELGLEPQQVKFWFQNKRTKVKTLSKRFDNHALRQENEKLQAENFTLRETLKNVHCLTCWGSMLGEENSSMQCLRRENALIYQEIERISKLLPSNNGINPMLPPIPLSSFDPPRGCLLNQNVEILAPVQIPYPGQHIHAHDPQIPALDHHIPTVDHDIPTHTPGLDQHISAITFTIGQNIPTFTPAHVQQTPVPVPAIDQDFSALISAIDQDISALF